MATARLSQLVQEVADSGTGEIRLSQFVLEVAVRTRPAGTPVLLKCDTTDQDDDGDPFQAYVRSRQLAPAGKMTQLEQVQLEPQVVAKASDGVELQLTITNLNLDGEQSNTSTVDLTPVAAESRVIRKFEGAAMADAQLLDFQIGDAEAIASAWSIDRLVIPNEDEGDA